MTKSELVAEVSRKTGVSKDDVEKVMTSTFNGIVDSVKRGDGFYCRGFGSFVRKTRAAKVARNITKGTPVNIPAHDVPVFNPYPEFKSAL